MSEENKYKCPDCGEEMTKEEFEKYASIDPCECPCWMIKDLMKFVRMKRNKIHKIGKHYYKEIPQDKNGEPKILRDIDDEDIFTLADCDGEPIKFFQRIKKNE